MDRPGDTVWPSVRRGRSLVSCFAPRSSACQLCCGNRVGHGGPMKAAHQRGGEDAPQQKPAASGSTLWSFEVVQQAAPKQG
ncbi:hypothetical protein IEJ02_02585 [Streptomyces sp. 5-10]|uniref:hypothetical protein n=1 Tax=Streptomyces sp. 5-6(2022) TaxID=2936510 RepID=UPI00168BA431|nr:MULTISPECIES: hypothetical protein [unclassified Streptomyces]MBD3003037.1 hypothetical protein [Streptomyces sp. 5-10]